MTDHSLIIFDCDGVLVDSEALSAAVLLEILADAGVVISEAEAYDRFLGRSMATTTGILEAEYGLPASYGLSDRMRARLFDRFRSELRPVPKVAEALGRLDRPICVASSSQPDRIALSLRLTGLAARFGEALFSATMVARGKPAPDLFLHAATEMGVAPSDCVVIEDSPAGVEAAQRAGMKVLGFVGGAHALRSKLRERVAALSPDGIFDDYDALSTELARLA